MSTKHPLSIIQQALGADWDKLATPIRQHYGLASYTNADCLLNGRMYVEYPNRVLPLIWAARLTGALMHQRGKDIAVEIHTQTKADSDQLFWQRQFKFPGRTRRFISRMQYLQDNEIIESVGWGLSIRLKLSVDKQALVFRSNGYLWRWGALSLSLPDWLLLGKARIIESALADGGLKLDFDIIHPLWGLTYRYGGVFSEK